MAIDMYSVHARERREAANVAYTTSSDFHALESEAAKRGYRKATTSEINASADRSRWAPELHCWRGGLWVKNN